ncbi:hypothetical protein ET495_08980 [Xylanimonas allomyrinae]|uniref:Uncharacterized protein n=1 Tax=Xylanimonas allomyrinae TaxID=2509459 RepID=A0A4P6EZ64_9MICO|nr:hypothetical protein [Xylanimonas allomyrinae]QAY63358.1 hypothetical protein ET495_08980 [Xylanimonas allomyrinae]
MAELGTGQATDLAARLADVGVGAVQTPPGADRDLVTTLDMVAGLESVTEGQGTRLWRVAVAGEPAPGWARVTDAAPTADRRPTTLAVLPSQGVEVHDRVPPAASPDQERTLVLAAVADSGWRATLDGQRLPVVDADGLQAFALPAEGGRLSVEHVDPRQPWWFAGAGVVLLVYVLLALPTGRRRGR